MPACSASEQREVFIDLSGEWLLTCENPGKNLTSECPENRILLPGSWTHIVKSNSDLVSLVRLEKEVFIDESMRGRLLVLSLGRIAVSDETFFNGVLIGRTGAIPDPENHLNYRFAWTRWRNYNLPETLIKYGAVNKITMRVYSHVINGVNGNLFITDAGAAAESVFHVQSLLDLDLKSIVINIILGMFFVLILVAYRKRLAIFYTFMIIIVVSVVQLNIMGLSYDDGVARFRVILALFSLGYLFFTLAVEQFFEITFKKFRCAILIITAAVELLVILAPDSKSLIYIGGTATLGLNIIMVSYYTVIFFSALKENFRRYWIFLITVIPLVVTTVQTYITFFQFEFHKMSSAFLFHLPIVLITLLLIMLLDFINVKTEMNLMKALLEFRTRALKRITNSLKKKPAREQGDRFNELTAYLDENFQERYNRSELAARFGFNEDYMCQLFKKKKGITISSYVNLKRVETSKELLLDSDSKIIDIAYHVGFESLVHFHREFKKHTGKTPQGYRVDSKVDSGC
jgi:two-component system response regulator YesN